jgi:hypothetical protein
MVAPAGPASSRPANARRPNNHAERDRFTRELADVNTHDLIIGTGPQQAITAPGNEWLG